MTDAECLAASRELAAEQAEDEGLWCEPESIMEAHLQRALRNLTAMVEDGRPFFDPFKTRAEAENRLVIISGREVCAYPDCKCPFDAPPNWCAQGLPQP